MKLSAEVIQSLGASLGTTISNLSTTSRTTTLSSSSSNTSNFNHWWQQNPGQHQYHYQQHYPVFPQPAKLSVEDIIEAAKEQEEEAERVAQILAYGDLTIEEFDELADEVPEDTIFLLKLTLELMRMLRFGLDSRGHHERMAQISEIVHDD